MCGSSTANSSPPRRATRSVSRRRRRERARDGLQRRRRRPVAVLSLICLEGVEVDHHQARDLAVALGARDLQLEVVLEQAAVAQAGERVVVGEVAQVLLELACARRCPAAGRCSAAARRRGRARATSRGSPRRSRRRRRSSASRPGTRGSRRRAGGSRCSAVVGDVLGVHDRRRSACRSAPRRCSR